jgi:ribosomal protein S18 acetylase RimI-like enzyme
MEISLLCKEDIENYKAKLNYLIEETIKLPKEATESYKRSWELDFIKKNLNNYLFLTSKIDGEIAGLILGTPPEGGVGTIIWVLVDPIRQGSGIGKKLLKKAYQYYKSKGAHKIKLTVPDKITLEFYKKQGMILEGFHPNHWHKADFWSMGKRI